MGAIKGKENILVWTDNALYTMKFVGAPFTFGFEQSGTNCGLLGQDALGVQPAVNCNRQPIYSLSQPVQVPIHPGTRNIAETWFPPLASNDRFMNDVDPVRVDA